MLCYLCKKNEASVPLPHIVDGVSREMNLCQQCADKHGFSIQLPIPLLTDFLFGDGIQAQIPEDGVDLSCPSCHMQRSDFHKGSQLGCETCYETFSTEITDLLEGLHIGQQHVGKLPAAIKSSHLEWLKSQVSVASDAENFELADLLSTRVQELS
jgi:protein arginine kinase activator